MLKYDITILTSRNYLNPKPGDKYVSKTILEDSLIANALKAKGLKVTRINWDDPNFDWSETRFALFRTTWDYSKQFDRFFNWFEKTKVQTNFINSFDLIRWNMDKNYLKHFKNKGIRIPKTEFLNRGSEVRLNALVAKLNWGEYVLKPAIAAGARHTYHFAKENVSMHEAIFKELLSKEDLLLQEYLPSIKSKGEISLMWFDNTYSHSILKRAKQGDFRIQEEHGGTVHPYSANAEEINFAKQVLGACEALPVYSRVDIVWDKEGNLCLGELEVFEPELWLRESKAAADMFARAVVNKMME